MKFFAPFRISENISKTDEGYLLCENVAIGRTGDMEYGVGETPLEPGPDGKVIVSRTAEELFRPETMASFQGKSITILHPEDFVNPKNWSELSKGVVQNVRRGTGAQENDLVCDFLIMDHEAIELVENGLREVSCGYEAEYTQTGVGRGFQSNIFGNHVALVEEGRAGSSYAINDHKGKVSKMKWSDLLKKPTVAAAIDKAMCDENTETPETKPGLVTMKDIKGYMDEKFAEMAKGSKDASEKENPETGAPAKPVAKDEDEPSGLEARLAKLEALVAKLVGAQAGDESEKDDEEVGDADEEGEESEDDNMEEGSMTGDSASEDYDDEVASRAEILAPGLFEKVGLKNLKAKALIASYATKDGKAAIHQFTGGKAPNTKDAKMCDALFVGVSEVLKTRRTQDVGEARVKLRDKYVSSLEVPEGAKSAEDINTINAKHYGTK